MVADAATTVVQQRNLAEFCKMSTVYRMTIRESIIHELNGRKTTDLAKLVGHKVRGLSERKLYDFIHYGKSLNSDALDVLLVALHLEVVSSREKERRQHDLRMDEKRVDQELSEQREVKRVVDARLYLLHKQGWYHSKSTKDETYEAWQDRQRNEYERQVKLMSPEERDQEFERCKSPSS